MIKIVQECCDRYVYTTCFLAGYSSLCLWKYLQFQNPVVQRWLWYGVSIEGQFSFNEIPMKAVIQVPFPPCKHQYWHQGR